MLTFLGGCAQRGPNSVSRRGHVSSQALRTAGLSPDPARAACCRRPGSHTRPRRRSTGSPSPGRTSWMSGSWSGPNVRKLITEVGKVCYWAVAMMPLGKPGPEAREILAALAVDERRFRIAVQSHATAYAERLDGLAHTQGSGRRSFPRSQSMWTWASPRPPTSGAIRPMTLARASATRAIARNPRARPCRRQELCLRPGGRDT
jgi:hypothetical protein